MNNLAERGQVLLYINEQPDEPWTADTVKELVEMYQVIALMAYAYDIPLSIDVSQPNEHVICLQPLKIEAEKIKAMVFFDIIYESPHLLTKFKLTTKKMSTILKDSKTQSPKPPDIRDTQKIPDLFIPDDDL